MADSRIDIIISLLNQTKGELKTLKNDLGDIDTSTKKSGEGLKDMGLSLTDLKSGFDLVIGGIKTFVRVANQAFDFTEQGAQVIQLTESFGRLGLSIEALRTAAGGTISDMDLMAAANKALAGTQGELRDAMAGALPGLIEMSRAAAKLDPTLGSAEHAFMSLVTGIKKGQPLLIDNTNAIVSVGEANERWAKANGKTVESMTAVDKQMALLEETLSAGTVMIDQVGGSLDSATDAWARYRSAQKNAMDLAKANIAEGVGPFIAAMAEQTEKTNLYLESGRKLPGNYAEAQNAINLYAEEVAFAAAQEERAAKIRADYSVPTLEEYNQKMGITKDVIFEVSDAMRDSAGNIINSADAFDQYNRHAGNMDNIKAIPGIAIPATRELANLGDAVGNLGSKFASFDTGPEAMWGMLLETGRAAGMTAEMLGDLAVEMGVAEESEVRATLAAEGLLQAYENRLINKDEFVAGVQALAEADALLAENAGIASGATDDLTEAQEGAMAANELAAEKAIAVAEKMGELGSSYNLVRDAEAQAGNEADILRGKLDSLNGTQVNIEFKYKIPSLPSYLQKPGEGGYGAMAAGGIARGGVTWVGERGPELITLPTGAAVTNNSVTNNYNTTVNTRATSGTYLQDIALVRALG